MVRERKKEKNKTGRGTGGHGKMCGRYHEKISLRCCGCGGRCGDNIVTRRGTGASSRKWRHAGQRRRARQRRCNSDGEARRWRDGLGTLNKLCPANEHGRLSNRSGNLEVGRVGRHSDNVLDRDDVLVNAEVAEQLNFSQNPLCIDQVVEGIRNFLKRTCACVCVCVRGRPLQRIESWEREG